MILDHKGYIQQEGLDFEEKELGILDKQSNLDCEVDMHPE